MFEQSLFDRIGKYQPEADLEKKDRGLNILKDRLKILFPELDPEESLKKWINSQRKNGKLRLLTEDPSAFKRVYVTDDSPDVVVKTFFGGSEKENWQTEKDHEDILRRFVGDFLPNSEHIEIEDADNPEEACHQIQDRLRGVQLKAFVGKMLDLLREEQSDDVLESYFANNPRDWSVLKRKVLRHFLPAEIWATAVGEARILAQRLEDLEKEYVISDLDFFITSKGKIKIIDFQLYKKEDFVPDQEGFPEGSDDLRLIFNLL